MPRELRELPILDDTEQITWIDPETQRPIVVIYPIRRPEFYGCRAKRWGQRKDYGPSMLISIDADQAELDKLPENTRRG